MTLMTKAVGGPAQPLNKPQFILAHPIHGWDPILKDKFFQLHGRYPTGHTVIAERAAFADHWHLNLASPEVRASIDQDLVDYKVRLVVCLTVSVANRPPLARFSLRAHGPAGHGS
jgi:hypothetical protein